MGRVRQRTVLGPPAVTFKAASRGEVIPESVDHMKGGVKSTDGTPPRSGPLSRLSDRPTLPLDDLRYSSPTCPAYLLDYRGLDGSIHRNHPAYIPRAILTRRYLTPRAGIRVLIAQVQVLTHPRPQGEPRRAAPARHAVERGLVHVRNAQGRGQTSSEQPPSF